MTRQPYTHGLATSSKMSQRPYNIITSWYLSSLLQSLLRQREGEVGQLRREVARLNETHEHLLSALSEQTARTDQCKPPDHLLSASEGDEVSLSQRYEVLLQLYGRKLEENEELRMDLREAKEAYQTQVCRYQCFFCTMAAYFNHQIVFKQVTLKLPSGYQKSCVLCCIVYTFRFVPFSWMIF